MKQKGYTLVELITCVVALGGVVLFGLGLYAIGHFISKFW